MNIVTAKIQDAWILYLKDEEAEAAQAERRLRGLVTNIDLMVRLMFEPCSDLDAISGKWSEAGCNGHGFEDSVVLLRVHHNVAASLLPPTQRSENAELRRHLAKTVLNYFQDCERNLCSCNESESNSEQPCAKRPRNK